MLTDLAQIAPCAHAGCPLGVDVPAIAAALAVGDHERAHRLARGANPFASTCGHACHAPCESACRRRQHGAPVAAAMLEAFAADLAPPALLPDTGAVTSIFDARWTAALAAAGADGAAPVYPPARIAIVGGGAAGLACALVLSRLGHGCVVFDDGPEPGGVLTRAIPAFRIPLASVRAECAAILATGIELRRDAVRGRSALRDLLGAGFDAVFLAAGAWRPREPLLGVLTSHAAEVIDAVDLLAGYHERRAHVVVVGDGDLAIDAARVAARTHAAGAPDASVELVLTAPIDGATVPTHALAAAMRDGVRLHAGWRPRRVVLSGETPGCVAAVEVSRDDGAAAQVLRCDQLVLAAPRAAAVHDVQADLALDGAGLVAVDPQTYQTSLHRVWAGGACAFGHRTIAHAIADGMRAGWQMHAALTGVAVPPSIASACVEAEDHIPELARRAVTAPRRHLPLFDAPPADPFSSARHSATLATEEAARCFDCTVLPSVDDECTGCGACVAPCPTAAIALGGMPRVAHIDPERCTRCGLCAEVCPEAAITMVRAVWELRPASGPSEAAVAPAAYGARAHLTGA
ncbi:MAG TPA: FAD-dependent oxidoreductase [Gemmatimonadaceae bacterium]|nr:FAD-dependent oxidoreductase [Gemmatimonadaceae bacterium]